MDADRGAGRRLDRIARRAGPRTRGGVAVAVPRRCDRLRGVVGIWQVATASLTQPPDPIAASRQTARSPAPAPSAPTDPRSEEHTSELQSLMRISYAVFCLK